MSDPFKELCEILEEIGARVTFDRRRNSTHPCWLCKEGVLPRNLVEIGKYTRPMGGGILPGDSIQRPLCAKCEDFTKV